MNVDVGLISELQRRTDRIRNVCVLAHVDHGKTTLSDHLIASNGLIHPKLAGEVRYMDSKDDEQARGITMKSSSISLLFVPGAATRADGPNAVPRQQRLEQGYLFNLIDSPGHVDFCSEVSTAARLSDGAFVVVDAVEGVCIQTHAVLRQAWEEKVKLCLVVNKIDRLILELCLTPLEAYERLKSIIAHVNMIVSSFHSEKFISEADAVLAYEEAKADGTAQRLAEGGGGGDEEAPLGEGDEEEEEEQAFAPERGNVAFGSAYDGWAFRINQFAEMYAAKMGCKAAALQRALWGDYAYQPKTKRIVRIKNDQQGRVKPLFVQLALEPIWKAYSACEQGADHAAILGRMVQGLGLSGITPRVLQHPDARAALRSVLRAWLPLSEAVLSMAAEHLPSPLAAAPERYARLLPARPEPLKAAVAAEGGAELAASLDAVEGVVRRCETAADAPLVLYVSKMVAVPAAALPRLPGEPGPAHPAEERFLAFGRVFSGVVRQGQTVQVLPATYNPADPASERQEVAVGALFLMMGRGLERLPEVPAGNILAIAGFDLAILKSATVASTPLCRPLAPMLFQSAPIVRVAVEPARPGDMPALVEGLRLLHRADPMVQVAVQETGEHVLCAAGEVHLETCIKDLKERFARCDLVVSPPLVAFRETVFCKEEAPPETTARPVFAVEASTPGGACTLRVMALPLPAGVATALDQNADLLRVALGGAAKGAAGGAEQQAGQPGQAGAAGAAAAAEAEVGGGTGTPGSVSLAALGERLRTVAAAAEQEGLLSLLQRAWLFGSKRVGPNLLLAAPGGSTEAVASSLFGLPPERVVKLAKQQAGRAALLPAAGRPESAASEAVDGGEEEEEAQEQRHLAVPLGYPEAALKLGLAASDETAASHAAAAVAHLSSQLGAMDVGSAGSAAPPANGSAAADGAPTAEAAAAAAAAAGGSLGSSLEYLRYSVESGVASGFQMAAAAGPLCDEPLWGVAFAVEARLNLPPGAAGGEGGSAAEAAAQLHLAEDVYGPFSGQVTSAARQALRRAVLEADPRLVEALFLCEVATSSEGLSAVYAVLGRRRARILREEMREGSDLFTVHAYLPAEASFGFADELRRRSSGAATASLMLSHWERLQVDPFFVPLTEEEREEFGEEGQGVGSANLAKRLIDAVRRRKGLPVEEKVVESATKQRTRARKTDAGLGCAELHPRGALLLAGSEQGDVMVFATSNGNLLQRLADPSSKPSPVTSVAWAQVEGVEHVVAGHKNGSVRVWRLDRAAVVATLAAHRSDVGVLAVMAPLALLATGGADGNIKLWQLPAPDAGGQHPQKPLALKEPRQKLKGHAGELASLHFTPDGEQLISGDSQGGLRVWEVAGGSPKAGRLAHNLSGHHSGAVSALACHPDERLFVSCSADRTLRVWDMDGPVPSCINTYGPEGRREPRAVAFTPGGRALLAAYPDGLRTFTLDPLQLCDTADGLQWTKVRSIRYLDGKVVGLTLFKGEAGLHCIDLTRMKPFSAVAAAAVESAARCAAAPAVPPAAATPSQLPVTPTSQPAAGVPQPGPAGAAAAQQRRQVLEARAAGANGKGPAIEVHAPPLRHARHATFTSAAPSGRAPAASGSATPPAANASQACEGKGGRPPRVSAEENGGAEGRCSLSGSKAELPSDSKFVSAGVGPAAAAAAPAQASQPSMLALSSDRGFQQAAVEGGRQLCAQLQSSRALLREVKAALQRGDIQGVVRKLKDAGDLSVAARVLDSRVLQARCPDRFTIELCAEAAPLCHSLLASGVAVHQQAALGLLDAMLGRWGDYVRGALSPAPSHRKVDIAAEARQQRSRVLQSALNTHVVPALQRLAAAPLGGGRAQQMLTRIQGL